MTTEQEFEAEIAAMWEDMRQDGDLVADSPARKVGMPWAIPYEGVCFPVEIDGDFVLASIPADQVQRFAVALVQAASDSEELDAELDLEYGADLLALDAISKAKDGQ